MNTASEVQNYSLTLNRNLNASMQEVYNAWTNIDALTTWFAPAKEMKTVVHKLELHIGGGYKIEMIETDGTTHVIHGEYVELNPFDQIAFTWEWESDEQKVNSLVTIGLSENNGTTNMVLTHDKLASQESVDLHTEGWVGCLAQLEAFANQLIQAMD